MILASQSPRRRELLAACGVNFTVKVADVDELDGSDGTPIQLLPQLNAEKKAEAVAILQPQELVLGADTMILLDDKALGKPSSPAEAAKMLRQLSGRSHKVITGLALIRCCDGVRKLWQETSIVHFKPLSDADITAYMGKVYLLDKAGSYAIQEHGEMIIDSFDGELENIIGLPLLRLRRELAELLPLADQ